MRQAKKLGVLGAVLALVAALGMLATGAGRVAAQAPLTNEPCQPGFTTVAVESCTITTTVLVVSGGTLSIAVNTPGVIITGVSNAGGAFFGTCTAPPGGLAGIGTATVVIGPCPPGNTIPVGTVIVVTLNGNPTGALVPGTIIYNANGPTGGNVTVFGTCGTFPARSGTPLTSTVTCNNATAGAPFTQPANTTQTYTFTIASTGGPIFVAGVPAGGLPAGCGAQGLPTPASAAPITVTVICTTGAAALVNPTFTFNVSTTDAGTVGTTPTETTTLPNMVVPPPTVVPVNFIGPINVGSAATKVCTGPGTAGSTGNTCTITLQTNAIPAGGVLVVTLGNPGWTVTACTGVPGITTAILNGTTVCIYQNATMNPILPGNVVGTETFSIPAAAPVGTLIVQTAQDCAGLPTATVLCTNPLGGFAATNVVITGLTQVQAITGGGLSATKLCTGTGVAGTTLSCVVTTLLNIPVGGSLQVTETNAGFTVTSCTAAAATTITATLSGTTICIFANSGAAAITGGTVVGTEVISIPAATAAGTVITQTSIICTIGTVPVATTPAGVCSAATNVTITGTAVTVAVAAGGARQPANVTMQAFLNSQTGTREIQAPDDLSGSADTAGNAAVEQVTPAGQLSLTGVNFMRGLVGCPAIANEPCADGTFQVRIVNSGTLAAQTAILGCDGLGGVTAPPGGVIGSAAGANPCQLLNNGAEVDVNCGATAGLVPTAAGISNTCSDFWFTITSSLGSCLANPLPVPVGGCQQGSNLGAGLSVTIQITFVATPGNGGIVGGVNVLPSATFVFAAPGVSALVVSASPFSIPSNGTLASVVTATFACTGPLATPGALLGPAPAAGALAGVLFPGFSGSPVCNPGLPGTFTFIANGPVIFDNGRQNESVSCGLSAGVNQFGNGALPGIFGANLTPPLAFSCTGAAVLAIGAGAAGDAPINVTFTSAVGGLNAVGSALIVVVPSGAPVIGVACNPSTIAAGGLGAICVATVTDINRVPLSGLTGSTVTFTVSDPTQATIIPCLVNIPSATINVTTAPNILPQLLPGGPCATPAAGIPGQVNTFVNGQASAVVVASPTAHPGPVTVTASLGILIPPSFSCIASPFITTFPGVGLPVAQNVPALGNPGLVGCGASAPFGASGLSVGLSQASLGFTGIVTMPNATSASTVVNIGGQFGILIAGSSITAPLILSRGCNQVIVTAATGTPIANIAALVSPQSAVVSIWRFNNGTKQFQAGFFSDPAAPTDFVTFGGTTTANVGNLPAGTVTTPIVGGGNAVVNTGAQLTETYFICVNQAATIASG